jgi:hypothetical protein
MVIRLKTQAKRWKNCDGEGGGLHGVLGSEEAVTSGSVDHRGGDGVSG